MSIEAEFVKQRLYNVVKRFFGAKNIFALPTEIVFQRYFKFMVIFFQKRAIIVTSEANPERLIFLNSPSHRLLINSFSPVRKGKGHLVQDEMV